MIETLPARSDRADLTLPAAVQDAFARFHGEIGARSQIVWGEHCSECAYPACYAHCAFYTPRADLHCRRFVAGFEPVDAPGARLHRVRFRKWGKLEGRGPAALRPLAEADARDRSDRLAQAAVTAGVLPHRVRRNLAWRWNERKAAPAAGPAADAFVVEAWAADGRTHPFTLTILDADKSGDLHQSRFTVGPDYVRHVVPLAEIAARVDLGRPYLVQIEPVGEAEGRDVVFGLCDFVQFRAAAGQAQPAPAAAAGEKPVKVVVWDLDETLWTGTLAEDGPAGVRVRPEAEALVRALDARGVLQSVASKNDEPLARQALEAAGLHEFFLHPQVHWNPKSGSLQALATTLDLGLDSFVFIDDQPFERAEVTAAHPQVRAVPHTEVASLIDHPWFNLPVTPESRGRRAMYQAEARRTQAYTGSGADYLDFLRRSGMRIDLRPLDAADAERVYELSQRTNQLNFNGTKLSRDAVAALVAGQGGELALTVRCADSFGDYGLIGFVVFSPAEGRVREIFMSCRVQRKRMENALFAWLAQAALRDGAETLTATWRPLERNGASREMLAALGFEPSEPADGVVSWSRSLARPFEDADVVPVVWAGDPLHVAEAA